MRDKLLCKSPTFESLFEAFGRMKIAANLRLGISQQGGIKSDDGECIPTPDSSVSSICKTQIYEIVNWDSLNQLFKM